MDWSHILDSPWSLARLLLTGASGLALWRGWRSGGLARFWSSAIAFMAAPVERDLCQREAKALRADNERLRTENERMREQLYGPRDPPRLADL